MFVTQPSCNLKGLGIDDVLQIAFENEILFGA